LLGASAAGVAPRPWRMSDSSSSASRSLTYSCQLWDPSPRPLGIQRWFVSSSRRICASIALLLAMDEDRSGNRATIITIPLPTARGTSMTATRSSSGIRRPTAKGFCTSRRFKSWRSVSRSSHGGRPGGRRSSHATGPATARKSRSNSRAGSGQLLRPHSRPKIRCRRVLLFAREGRNVICARDVQPLRCAQVDPKH